MGFFASVAFFPRAFGLVNGPKNLPSKTGNTGSPVGLGWWSSQLLRPSAQVNIDSPLDTLLGLSTFRLLQNRFFSSFPLRLRGFPCFPTTRIDAFFFWFWVCFGFSLASGALNNRSDIEQNCTRRISIITLLSSSVFVRLVDYLTTGNKTPIWLGVCATGLTFLCTHAPCPRRSRISVRKWKSSVQVSGRADDKLSRTFVTIHSLPHTAGQYCYLISDCLCVFSLCLMVANQF